MNSLPGLRSRGGFLIEIFPRYFLHKSPALHRFTPAERPRVSGSALVGCCWCALCGSLWGSVAAFLLWVVCLYLRTVSALCGALCGLCEGVPVSGVVLWLALVPSVGSDPLAGTGVPVERSGAVRAREKPPTRSGRTGERKPRERSRGCFYLFIFNKSAINTKKKIITHKTINNLAALPSMLP